MKIFSIKKFQETKIPEGLYDGTIVGTETYSKDQKIIARFDVELTDLDGARVSYFAQVCDDLPYLTRLIESVTENYNYDQFCTEDFIGKKVTVRVNGYKNDRPMIEIPPKN